MLARQSLYAIAVPILCAIHSTIQAIAVLVTHIAGLATTTDTTLFLAQKWLAAGLNFPQKAPEAGRASQTKAASDGISKAVASAFLISLVIQVRDGEQRGTVADGGGTDRSRMHTPS